MMKKIFTAAICCIAFLSTVKAGNGGYLGHRIIICGEGIYSPMYYTFNSIYTKYSLQYGGSLHIIAGRYTQVGLNYHKYSLGFVDRNTEFYSADDRIKGYQAGITIRRFRKEKGGLAPIGKFFDFSLQYGVSEFIAAPDNFYVETSQLNFLPPGRMASICPQIGMGSQMIFKDHFVLNGGFRAGFPIHMQGGSEYKIMRQRLSTKDYFTAFFGAGFIL
jgi:hypothetical protein